VIVRRDPPLGWIENFLTTAQRASGELIAFCDQDDVWLPGKLARMLPFFGDARTELVVCNSTPTDEALRPVSDRRHTGLVNRARWAGIYAAPPGNRSIYRSQLIREFSWDRRPLSFVLEGEASTYDEWMFFLAQCFGRTVTLNESFVLWRRHGRSVTGIQKRASRRGLLQRPPTHGLKWRRDAVRSREEFCADALEGEPPGLRRSALLTQQARYRRLGRNLERRMGLYARRSPIGYFAHVCALVVVGAYGRQARGGLGWLDLVQDLLRIQAPIDELVDGGHDAGANDAGP
jgi:hypothetical protein